MSTIPFQYVQSDVTSLGLELVRRRALQSLEWAGGHKVLEIGPGRGVLAREAIALGREYWAVDERDDVLADLPPQAHCVRLRLPTTCWPDGTCGQFDAVICEAVIEHMPGYDGAVLLLAGIEQSLRIGGRLVLRAPDAWYSRWGFWDFAPDHQYVTTVRRLSGLLQSRGWRIIDAGIFVDQFTGWRAWLIWQCTRWLPAGLLGRMTGHRPWQCSTWWKIRGKVPQAYVVAEKEN